MGSQRVIFVINLDSCTSNGMKGPKKIVERWVAEDGEAGCFLAVEPIEKGTLRTLLLRPKVV